MEWMEWTNGNGGWWNGREWKEGRKEGMEGRTPWNGRNRMKGMDKVRLKLGLLTAWYQQRH